MSLTRKYIDIYINCYIPEFIKTLTDNADIKVISTYKRKLKIEVKKEIRYNY